MISVKEIRDYALNHMAGSVFASVIAKEKDEISESEFKAKLSVWFTLLALEQKED